MSEKPSYFRIGLFVLIALAFLVAGLVVLGAGAFLRQRMYIETYVNASVQGIDVGSPVKFRGVQIGRVSAINFTFNEYGSPVEDRFNYVVILMEIDREMFPGMFIRNIQPLIEKNIEQGLRARIEPLGITGMNYIDINYVNDPSQFPPLALNWKPHYYYIPSAPGQLTNMLDSINNIMRQVEGLNIRGMSKAGTELLDNLNKAVASAEIGKISANLQALLDDFQSALNAANIGELSSDARQLISGLEKSNGELRAILRDLEPVTKISGPQVKVLMNNLTITSANLAQLSAEVKRRPSLLLWGSPPQPKTTPTPRKRR
jgi:phospholipid/cholesterol/gamma-HCH transport system substrate-binding protein